MFADDLIGARMQYVAEQMHVYLEEDQTLEEIAQLTGFASEDEFSEQFAKQIGITLQAHLDNLRAKQ